MGVSIELRIFPRKKPFLGLMLGAWGRAALLWDDVWNPMSAARGISGEGLKTASNIPPKGD
jgi:hypothetical protein